MKKIITSVVVITGIVSFSVMLISGKYGDYDKSKSTCNNPHNPKSSGGAPPAVAGDPYGGNKTCDQAGCHNSYALQHTKNATITTDIPSTGYVAGQTYNITARVVTSNAFFSGVYGFENTVQDASGNPLGTIAL